jgi:P4 family phage/plasmid primase-like protien
MPETPFIPDLPEDTDNVTAAIEYAKAGLYVLPVKRGEKHPGSVVGKDWQQQSSRDIDQIVAWFVGTDHGIAIHCGRSGLVVLDVDHPELKPEGMYKDLNDVPYQATRDVYAAPGRGHYIFRQPAGRNLGNSNGSLGREWGEVRGHNGVIIAYPSEHSSPDGQYRWVRTGSIPELPPHLADRLPDAEPADTAATDEQVCAFLTAHVTAESSSKINGWIRAFANHCEQGSRHNGMVSVLAGALKEAAAGYFPAQLAVDTLRAMFLDAATRAPTGGEKQRSAGEAEREFSGILSWAVAQASTADLDRVRERTAAKMPDTILGLAPVTPINSAPTAVAAAAIAPDDGMTETQNAVDLVARHRDTLRYCPEIKRWFHWTGAQWEQQADDSRASMAAREIARSIVVIQGDTAKASFKNRSRSKAGILNMVELARRDIEFQVARDLLDANAYELNTPTGIVDLRTATLRPHDPFAWHTKITGVEFPTGAWPFARRWNAFLHDTFGGDQDLIDYMQQLFGIALIGEVLEHLLPFMFGVGANGKSVMLEVVRRVFGSYATVAAGRFLVAGRQEHEAEIVKLVGARMVICSEVNEDSRFDEAKVKSLTGGDGLSGRYLYGQSFDFVPSHTLFLAGNHQPGVNAGGLSFWRRLRLIPFNHVVPEDKRNEHLAEELFEEEGPAILAWIVKGAKDVADHGLLEPDSVKAATAEYAASEDVLGQFLEECTEVSADAVGVRVDFALVYARYVRWCEASGITSKGRSVFGRDLSARLGRKPTRSNGKSWIEGMRLIEENPVKSWLK